MSQILLAVWALTISQSPVVRPRGAAQQAVPVVLDGPLYTPANAVAFALVDMQTVPVQRRSYVRYLSLYNVPRSQRVKVWETVSFLANSLSSERVLTRPLIVPGSDGTLIRLCLDDYAWSARAWDDLAEKGSGPNPTPDPYFHALIETDEQVFDKWVENGTDYYGRTQWKESYRKEHRRVLAAAPWLSADGGLAVSALITATQTKNPILRADWFIANASLPPAYYRFFGLDPNGVEGDFEGVVFADKKLAAKARLETKGVVVSSRVALHNRTLTRFPTIAGYYWESHDTKKSVDDRDYLNVLLDEKFDAKEVIATLPNGLQAYAVVDAQGKLQEKADADVAQDFETILQDKQVRTGRNCISCHAAGIRPIGDEVRALSRDKIALLVADPEQARRIKDLFGVDLGRQVDRDATGYAEAVRATNGLASEVNAAQFERQVYEYADATLGLDRLTLETGVPGDKLLAVLQRGLGLDHTLTGILQTPPRPMRRDQFEKSFGQLMLLLGQQRN